MINSSNSKTLSIRLAATGGDQLRREFDKLGTRGQRAFDGIKEAAKPASKEIKSVDAAAKMLNRTLKQAAGLLGAYTGIRGLTRTFSFLVSTNREFEKLHASLQTVTGSLQGADGAFKMIEDFAAHTPFSVEQLTESFIKLKALGLDPSADALRSYGNTASAMGKDLLLFVDAVANATTGRFMNLKSFGINAEVQGDKVAFTFNKVKTSVRKNATEIEAYLRNIGKTQFAGAMTAQMDILEGIFSNIKDNLSHIAREIGHGGFTQAVHDVGVSIRDATTGVDDAAHAIGETLGNAIRMSATAFGFLYQYAGLAVEGLEYLLVARTVAKAFSLLRVAMVGNAGLIIGLRLVSSLSAGTAAKIILLESASKLATVAMLGLKRALALVGGPAGLVAIVGFGLYKLVEGHEAAAAAAKRHADELGKLMETIKQAANGTGQPMLRNEAIARLTEQLNKSKQDAADLMQQIRSVFPGNFWDHMKDVFHPSLMTDLEKIRQALWSKKNDLDAHLKAIWNLSVKYPGFTKQADEVDKQIKAYKKSQLDIEKGMADLIKLKSGLLNPNPNKKDGTKEIIPALDEKQIERINDTIHSLQAQTVALQRLVDARKQGNEAVQRALILNEQESTLAKLGIDIHQKQNQETNKLAKSVSDLITKKYKLQQADKEAIESAKRHAQTVQDITRAFNATKSEGEQARIQANSWHDKSLAGLDTSQPNYPELTKQVEAVYQNTLSKAREKDLESSKHWQDGLTRGFQDVINDAQDMASQVENAITNAFSNMENALTEFVMHGKMDFKSLADSIIADILRIQIKKNISAPIASALGTINWGGLFGAAHTGGVIGHDKLMKRAVNSSVFDAAPKFHGGGVVGNEVPIIAKRGETVFTPGQMHLLNEGLSSHNTPVQVNVTVHNNVQGVQAKTHATQTPNGNVQLDIVVEHVEEKMARKVTRGDGLAKVLEQRYGLNPAKGSYR